MTGCSLDTEIYDNKDDKSAFSSVTDIRAAMNGAYDCLANYEFLGNYAISVGDMVSGVSKGSSSSGHMIAYSTFTFTAESSEIEDMWAYGYYAAANATNAIKNAKQMIADGKITQSEQGDAFNYIGQCYAIKAMTFYNLVNYFGLPYSSANASTPGIVIYDMDVPAEKAKVARSTVGETYDRIQKDIDSAEVYLTKYDEVYQENNGTAAPQNPYYMGMMGVKALKANVLLALGQYADAETAAKEAIDLLGTGNATGSDNVPSASTYVSMWGGTNATTEDIYTIPESSSDNLSANALNTLYGSYYCSFQKKALSKLASTDIRRRLLSTNKGGTTSIKFDGVIDQAVCNIPVFRKSEMALIIAECEARVGSISEAQNYLLFTAKRNTAITSTSDLPSTKDELLSFINDERVREFFGEGKRYFNARRTGEIISGDNFSDWDISKFVFPIPSAEINAGWGVTQNEGWSNNLPK